MTQTKKFASQADLEEKQITFSQISAHAWAYNEDSSCQPPAISRAGSSQLVAGS